jgi:hypothetical protein
LSVLYAQQTASVHVESFTLSAPADSAVVHLTKPFVISSTVRVSIQPDIGFRSSFIRSSNLLSVYFDSSARAGTVITVSYTYFPLELQPSYQLRTLTFQTDTLGRPKKDVVVGRTEGVLTNMFGPELTKSGSISRGFLVGSNRDLTLSSGFRLQMAGKLSNDIDIIAALTDENTPIQPQGNTQTLQEIDNVFVEIKSPSYTATLGDFQFSSRSGEFVNVNRKLQGAKVEADYSFIAPRASAQVTGATSRGKFNTNQFQGIEGVQGPYRLTGKNNERAIIIIAGSEKVYVDGVVINRGENNDYTVEYGAAEVTFTTRRLITGASRIVIDFEYADRQFTRNFIGVDAGTEVVNGFEVRANYFREGDDPDAPIDITLNEAEKAVLRQSGNAAATITGVVFVGRDSLGIGKGNYRSVDTTVNGSVLRIYQYEQQTADAVYAVSFSPVGPGNGDYRREGIGRYVFAGVGAGQYAPVVLLPTPQLHQLYSMQSNWSILQGLNISGEYAASDLDRNRFSAIGDQMNAGGAWKFALRYNPKKISIGTWNIGAVDLSVSERFKQARFQAMDRTDEVEFGRKWSTDSLSAGVGIDEEVREAKFTYLPTDAFLVSTGYGTLNRTGEFFSERYEGTVSMKVTGLPEAVYSVEQINGEEKRQFRSNEWFRQRGDAVYEIDNVSPSFRFENERRTVQDATADSILSSSYAFMLVSPKVTVKELYGFDLSSEFEWRNDDAVNAGQLIPQSSSVTQQYAVAVREVKDFSASTVVTVREKLYAKAFQAENLNQQTTLIKLQSRYRPFSQGLDIDLFYDAATQRTAKLERYFYKVRKGEGQYTWTDANGNGIIDLNDEREFIPDRYDGEYIALTLNSDALIPVISVKASSRLRVNPAKIIGHAATLVERIVSNVSSESFFRLEERSTEQDIRRIYLLDRNALLDPITTLAGYQFFQQDIFLFEYRPEFSFRFRFNQRNGLTQFASGNERNYSRERSLRSRFQLSNDITNQTDVIIKDDNAVSSSLINRTRRIEAISLVTDLSYRPEQRMEIGLKLETSQSEDRGGILPVAANFNGQSVRVVYGFLGNGQVRSEFSREEILMGNQPSGYIPPYELTAGRDFGKNYLWSLSSEYRMGGNVQFSLLYSGRTTSRAAVVHTGRMEVRAFF